ncbi:transposase-like protein [Nocardioides sp. BE266]|uniref:transposase n=1 Tax=Nocardioides sp. BE266 TaxID=2817725 RepID=UPI0028572CC0|nr:transposase [Nocardioides sp. BE266]MDR7253731.1 transposase-like protein [Nocardioides sp. BE266]
MSNRRAIPDHIRTAAINDYRASGEPLATVARRHGVSKTALSSWITPQKKRGPKQWGADELALTGGRWVNVRGVMRWESFTPRPVDCDLTDRQRRMQSEDAMFTEDEARQAHAAYAYGRRDPRTVVGERVYNRRKKRARYESFKKAVA